MSDCLFCRIAAGDIPSRQVHADDTVVAFEDIQPRAPVHVLVIPRAHIATLDDAGPEHAGLLGHLMLTAARIARERGIAAAGYRLVLNCNAQAGQSVWHVHLHLLGGRDLAWPPG